jgi:hypothetical protein
VAIEVVAGVSPARLKSLRLSALKDAPYAFGAKYADELLIPDNQWQERLLNTYWCFVVADGVDVGLLAVKKQIKIAIVIAGYLAGELARILEAKGYHN